MASEPASAKLEYYQVKGEVRDVRAESSTVVIKHEEVPGYMAAMTMPFEVKDTNELRGLQRGDIVSFRMAVASNDAWIEQIKKVGETPALAEATDAQPQWRLARDVDPLNVGDRLPDYHFTNELGHAVSTSQFKGQAVAFTFFFTRCPYPTFCPLMSNNFNDAARKLEEMPNGPKNWHLFSISFDTEFDGPEVLKGYAGRYENRDPAHWSFLTGDLTEITAIADQVGESFWHEGPSITHNLRTVVVDAQGRVQRIIPENKWTSDELVAELVKAAQAKP
jgi:protein SCO1/2